MLPKLGCKYDKEITWSFFATSHGKGNMIPMCYFMNYKFIPSIFMVIVGVVDAIGGMGKVTCEEANYFM